MIGPLLVRKSMFWRLSCTESYVLAPLLYGKLCLGASLVRHGREILQSQLVWHLELQHWNVVLNSNEGEGVGDGEGGLFLIQMPSATRLYNRHLFYWFWFVFFKPFVQDFPTSHVFQFKATSESGILLFPFRSYGLDFSWKGLTGTRVCLFVYLFNHCIIFPYLIFSFCCFNINLFCNLITYSTI